MSKPSSDFGKDIDLLAADAFGHELSYEMPVSATYGEVLLSTMGVRCAPGQKVLDVAAGFSTASAVLRQAGVDAYAVDPCYANMDEAIRRADEFSAKGRRLVGCDDFLNEHGTTNEVRSIIKEARQQFLADISEHPEKYKTGFSTSLPFAADQFDTTMNATFLASFAGTDLNFAFASVKEMLRVTKRGGAVRIGTWFDGRNIPKPIEHIERLTRENLQTIAYAALDTKAVRKVTRFSAPHGDVGQILTLVFQKR